jgi:two-component system cell cycle sensor histidine kinase/response regulator CckA
MAWSLQVKGTSLALAGILDRPFYQATRRFGPKSGRIAVVAVLMSVAAGLSVDPRIQTLLAMVSVTLICCALWLVILNRWLAARRDDHIGQVAAMIENDPAPVILADPEGAVLRANASAYRAFPMADAPTLDAVLDDTLANPGAFLRELANRAQNCGAAVGHVPNKDGSFQVSVHRTGEGPLLWRFEIGGAVPCPPGDVDDQGVPMRDAVQNPALIGLDATQECPIDRNVAEHDGMAGPRAAYPVTHLHEADHSGDAWAFFEELPVPLLKLARDGMIRQSNRPGRDLLGVDSTQDMAFGDALEGLGRSIKDWIDDAASGRGTVHAEFLRVRRDDREVFVQVTLNRAMEAGESVLIAVMNDATELKSLEAQFVQSQKMQAIGQLAGGVAHDFNNLLTAITGHCDLLLLRHDQGDPDYADLMQINQNANRAAALVSQLLAYSRKQTLRPQLIDLRETLADLTHLLNRLVGEKVSLGLSHDPALSAIRADKRQLEQVIMNLVVNARDAMPKGGDIRILTENVTLTEPLRRDRAVVAPGLYVSVKIIDAGVGISPDKAQKVFEPFFTTKRAGEGTGLGLSTAYGIVKQTGGFIFLDSVPDEGTVFQLLFPAHTQPDACEVADTGDAVLAGPASGVVLLVEDEAPVRAFASRALQMRGYTVLEAESAEDALDLLEDPAVRVDVFVTDVVMPGLDGPTWVQQALGARPEARVVFMSGYAEETFSEVQARIPHSVFLPKPFSLKELTDTVQRQTG